MVYRRPYIVVHQGLGVSFQPSYQNATSVFMLELLLQN